MRRCALKLTLAVYVGVGLLGRAATLAETERVSLDGVAAVVGDHAITFGDTVAMVAPVRQQLASAYSGTELRQRLRKVFDDALETLIARQLILRVYENQDRIKIPDWLVERRIEEIMRESYSNDRAALMSALAKDHLSYEQWRQSLHEHMIVSYMRRLYVDDNVALTPTEASEEYDRNMEHYRKPAKIRLSMLVMRKGPSGDTAAAKRKQAEDVRKQLQAGADFGTLAKALSEGGKAKEGGDWGWIEPRILRAELAAAVESLKPSEVSNVIEVEDELYILRLAGRQNETVRSFEDVQADIERELRKVKADAMYAQWIARLRDQAYVQVLDGDPFGDVSDVATP